MAQGAHGVNGSGPVHAGKPAVINATILFIDLMNSVALSTALSLWEYNDLINDYQSVLRSVLDEIRGNYQVNEWYLGGDQLAAFFYHADDAGLHERAVALRRRNPGSARADEIDAQLLRNRNRALYGALRCAVNVKNAWMGHPRNISRVETDQPALDVGIGINTGNVILQHRTDGTTRIEGFAINYAKRVEGFARHGRYCRVMLSKSSYETFRSIVAGHSMLKQRAFFETYYPGEGQLKGLSAGLEVYELKFFHRLLGFAISPEYVRLYAQIFENDPTNIWAYANLMNYHLYQEEDVATSLAIAQRGLYSNPRNEKIYFDLAKINHLRGEFDLAHEYCRRCLELNPEMDIAYDLLADVEVALGGSWDNVLKYRSQALALTPGSASYHYELAVALAKSGRLADGRRHYHEAKRIYPEIDTMNPETVPLFAAAGKHS
jgi:tetratricopeptide (TPR) repeat protein